MSRTNILFRWYCFQHTKLHLWTAKLLEDRCISTQIKVRFKHWCTSADELHHLLYWFYMVRTKDIARMCYHMDFQHGISNSMSWSVGNILHLYTYTMLLMATWEQNAFSTWLVDTKVQSLSNGRAISMHLAKLLFTLYSSLQTPLALQWCKSMPQHNVCIITFGEDYSQ